MATRVAFAYGQSVLPIFPISIFELDRDRRTDRLSMPDSGENVRRVPLDLHASTTAVALLPPPQLAINKGLINLQSRGQA
jgi:hypothetical protein